MWDKSARPCGEAFLKGSSPARWHSKVLSGGHLPVNLGETQVSHNTPNVENPCPTTLNPGNNNSGGGPERGHPGPVVIA